MRKALAWVALLGLAMILIIAGSTGRVGSVMAAIITPSALADSTS